MKKLISKIRNKKLNGNISLLVILILLASSVIALLSINQIQHLITYGNMTFNYFRAFYLAKAGNELGLTEVYNRSDGFEHNIGSGYSIITGNLIGVYSGFDPYFTMDIQSNFKFLTDDVRYTDSCSSGNKITLGTGDGIMLSLFKDKTQGIDNILKDGLVPDHLSEGFVENNIKFEDLKWHGSPVNYFIFGLFSYKNDMMDKIHVETGINLSDTDITKYFENDWGLWYLTIKNPGTGNEVAEFCIGAGGNKEIPYSNFLLTSHGNYGDMEVGIQSVVKKEVPSWSLDVLGWSS